MKTDTWIWACLRPFDGTIGGDVDVAVAVRAGRPAWVNRRTILGLVLVGLSVFGGYSILEAADESTPVVVTARDLPSGAAITATSLRVEQVQLPPTLRSEYASSIESVDGLVITKPLAAGELIPQDWVASEGSTPGRSITIPIDPEHAVGGLLRPGDLVDLFATFDPGDVGARTVTLARETEVVDVVSAGGLVMGDKAVVGLTLSVGPADAKRIAFAVRNAQLDVVRIDDPTTRAEGSVVTGADF